MYVPDNYDAWKEHDRRQSRALRRRPLCERCGEPIQSEECYEINGELICLDCMKDFLKQTEDYMV